MLTAASTKANSKKMKFLEKVATSGLMARHTKANGKRIRCMAEVSLSGRMESAMREISSMINVKVKVLSSGLMADAISEDGVLESKMEREPTLTKRMRPARESGKMVAKFSG